MKIPGLHASAFRQSRSVLANESEASQNLKKIVTNSLNFSRFARRNSRSFRSKNSRNHTSQKVSRFLEYQNLLKSELESSQSQKTSQDQ